MANTERVRAVMAHIRTNPKDWDQDTYGYRAECGTRHCVAGWTVAMFDPTRIKWVRALDGGHEVINQSQVFDIARDLLELTCEQADEIFFYQDVETDGMCGRGPTLDEMEQRITAVTGVTFP